MDEIDKIYKLMDDIQITDDNRELVSKIKKALNAGDIIGAVTTLKKLQKMGFTTKIQKNEIEEAKAEEEEVVSIYPEDLASDELEEKFIGKLLNEVKAISVYYIPFKECYFINEELLNIYKTILYTDAERHAPEKAKEGFNFARRTEETDRLKYKLRKKYSEDTDSIESVYSKLRKLFCLRKNYLGIPVKSIQKEVSDIVNYELYDKMTIEEVKSAIEQITATEKFKRSILNVGITDFLVNGDNTLTNGLDLPFPILTSVFKGIRVR